VIARSQPLMCRGQALVEALIALLLLAALMHGMVMIGAIALRAMQAAQWSRLAVFADAERHTAIAGDSRSRTHVEFIPMDGEYQRAGYSRGDAHRQDHGPQAVHGLDTDYDTGNSHKDPARETGDIQIGNVRAGILARDWLPIDARLRRAQATVYPVSMPAVASANVPASMLSVRRDTVIAAGTGHGVDHATVVRRMDRSPIGWSSAAQRSASITDAVTRRMQGVDTSWMRSAASTDWLSVWGDLGPASAPSAGLAGLAAH